MALADMDGNETFEVSALGSAEEVGLACPQNAYTTICQTGWSPDRGMLFHAAASLSVEGRITRRHKLLRHITCSTFLATICSPI